MLHASHTNTGKWKLQRHFTIRGWSILLFSVLIYSQISNITLPYVGSRSFWSHTIALIKIKNLKYSQVVIQSVLWRSMFPHKLLYTTAVLNSAMRIFIKVPCFNQSVISVKLELGLIELVGLRMMEHLHEADSGRTSLELCEEFINRLQILK